MPEVIGHYQIREKLGSGGMGDVYLAEDTKLHRLVALKLLPAEVALDAGRRTRFLQEAHAASVLNHPNVSTIYEVGEHEDSVFIAMEYIEGRTLTQLREQRPVNVDEVIDIALQAADALDEAAARGIVHRDIKSANIMLTPRGHVKVLDFGLAKVIVPDAAGDDTKIKTSPGMVMGTPYYMSPEQALGRAVDQRSDLFSLGIVLYELVTGRLPFVGTTTTETIEKITHSEPEPIARFNYSLPGELERIIRKLLEKDPSRRYQSARDLVVDLKNLKRDTSSGELVSRKPVAQRRTWMPIAAAAVLIAAVATGIVLMKPWKRAPAPGSEAIASIAVMPFVNAGKDPDSEYLSDGISESIINDLSRISGLRVIPRSTVFRYKGQETDVLKVAEALDVQAVVTGHVLRRGDVLSVQAELVDARSNAQLWGARYERKVADALAMQQEISGQISERLHSAGTALPAGTGNTRMTADPEAYQLYLKGRYHWNRRTGESINRALDYYEQAVARDPKFALAYVGLADSHLLLEQYADKPLAETTARAEQSVRRALEIDDGIAEAHASLAMIHQNRRRWEDAENEFKRSIALNPNYATARHWYNIYLRDMGRVDEAWTQVQKARELDPLSMIIGVNVVTVLLMQDRDDEAVREAEKYLELDPSFPQMLGVASRAYTQVGRHQEAIAAARKAVETSDGVNEQLAQLANAYAAAGDREAAMTVLRRLEERVGERGDPYFTATVYAALGDRDRAFAALERSERNGGGMVKGLLTDDRLVVLRSDPRLKALARKMGIPV
jgi:serine/threonine protein kinase/tetratricopeptide (TPR) repeat protein